VTVAPAVVFAQESLDWPALGRAVSEPSSSGQERQSVDIRVPEGTPIRASADGKVVYVGNEVRGQGNMLLVQHQDGLITAYTGASCIAVRKDNLVQRGQIVAYAGTTGDRIEPGIHFEVHDGGKTIDPRRLLPPQSASKYGPHPLDAAVLPCVDFFKDNPMPAYLRETRLR
jgi:murein DD-endopeptidase MepM/ murein hydrolase activator NlpD